VRMAHTIGDGPRSLWRPVGASIAWEGEAEALEVRREEAAAAAAAETTRRWLPRPSSARFDRPPSVSFRF
jgi:hypothetical protein